MSKHTAFILRPLSKILNDSSLAIGHIRGLQKIPLIEYFMQSVFLRMTGAQEQKMKCVCWELATEDYEYRYKRYNGKWNLGECSNYDAKNEIYGDLITQIHKLDNSYSSLSPAQKQSVVNQVIKDIQQFYKGAGLQWGLQHDYQTYNKIMHALTNDRFSNANNQEYTLLAKKALHNTTYNSVTKQQTQYDEISLVDMYDLLHDHRNRCAHNTLSYQENPLPFRQIANPKNIYENYFLRFTILLLIDYIFIENYKKYLALIK